MTDAMVQLAKEFLEVHGYTVSTSVKMPLKGKNGRTESDVDIVAHRYKKPFKGKTYDKLLNSDYIIAEVKGTLHGIPKEYFNEIYKKKFNNWDKKSLRRYAPLSKTQKILFCSHTTKEVIDEAEKDDINIVTAAHMLKALSNIIKKKKNKRYTYYTEWPIYSSLRELIYLLNGPQKEYKDNLLLKDLLWIAEPKHARDRNKFIDQNRKTLVKILQGETSHETLDGLMKNLKIKI